MRSPYGFAAASLVAALLASCGGTGRAPAGDDPNRGSDTPEFPGAPSEIIFREQLPFCGEETLEQGGGGRNEKARRCLAEALRKGHAAELVSTSPTVEGDPITTIYRVRRDGDVVLFVDDSEDAFAARPGWSAVTCRELEPVRLAPHGCGAAKPL